MSYTPVLPSDIICLKCNFGIFLFKKMNIKETPTIPAYIDIGKQVIEKKLFGIDDYKMSSIRKEEKNRGDSKAVATMLLWEKVVSTYWTKSSIYEIS